MLLWCKHCRRNYVWFPFSKCEYSTHTHSTVDIGSFPPFYSFIIVSILIPKTLFLTLSQPERKMGGSLPSHMRILFSKPCLEYRPLWQSCFKSPLLPWKKAERKENMRGKETDGSLWAGCLDKEGYLLLPASVCACLSVYSTYMNLVQQGEISCKCIAIDLLR